MSVHPRSTEIDDLLDDALDGETNPDSEPLVTIEHGRVRINAAQKSRVRDIFVQK